MHRTARFKEPSGRNGSVTPTLGNAFTVFFMSITAPLNACFKFDSMIGTLLMESSSSELSSLQSGFYLIFTRAKVCSICFFTT